LRIKTCLTEENAQIKPYDENKWSALYDANHSDIHLSLNMLEGIHGRLADLFGSLAETDWAKTIYHPESKHTYTLAELLALYAWHGTHHLGHLKIIREKSGQ
ncbi:MAG: DinB family protein, partial [Bacteroidia bacterium]